MVKIKLVDQQIESIVIDELKLAYALNIDSIWLDVGIDQNQNLLDSIKRVLCYYMTRDEYEQWEASSTEHASSETAFTIAVKSDQIDRVVEDDLKIVYEMNYKPESCGVYGISLPDTELVSSVDQLLQYYMSELDYKQWKGSLK